MGTRHASLFIATLAALASAPGSALAQTHPNALVDGKVRTFVGSTEVNINDSVDVYKLLVANTPVEPEFRSIPRFAVIGTDHKFFFSIGANLKFTACYDWGNPVPDPSNLAPSQIKPAQPSNHQLLQMTAQQSNVYFNIIGFPESADRVGLFVSFAMDGEPGNTYKLHASQVYMRYRHFQCGYTTSLYNDRSADAYLIDGHGPISSGAHDDIQINYQKYFQERWRMGISVELPSVSCTPYVPEGSDAMAQYPNGVNQTIPTVPFYVGYNWGGSNHVRLTGVVRTMRYRDFVASRTRLSTGWGVKLTSAFNIRRTTTYLMAQTGCGIASFFQDDRGFGLDMVPDGDTGRLANTSSWGFVAGVQYNFTPQVYSTALFSYMRNYVKPYQSCVGIAYTDQMRRGRYLAANVIWQISTLFRCGIEYTNARKVTFGFDRLADHRLTALLLMTF